MTAKKLDELCDFISGLWTGKKPPYVNVGVLRNTNFHKSGNLDFSDIAQLEVESKQFSTRQLKFGDIVLEKSGGGPKQPVGRVCVFEKSEGLFSLSNFTSAIRVKDEKELDYKYLHYFLKHQYITGETEKIQTHSTGIRNLQLSLYKEFLVPLPPLPIQQKIVARLDAIFAEIDKATAAAEANAKNANLLVRGTITTLIKKFSEDCFVKFGDICGFVRGPFGGSLKKSIFVEKGYAVYEQQHPINNQFDSFRYFITDEKFNEMKRFEVFPHDLLMSCSGVTLGKIAIVPKDAPKGIINQALLKITPKDVVRKDYLKLLMDSDYFQSILWDVSGGAAQPNVPSVKVIKDFLIPLPTIKEQDNFIDIVSKIISYDLSSTYKEKKKSFLSLKQAILKQAFNGELVKE